MFLRPQFEGFELESHQILGTPDAALYALQINALKVVDILHEPRGVN
jgi:hypothetical protein